MCVKERLGFEGDHHIIIIVSTTLILLPLPFYRAQSREKSTEKQQQTYSQSSSPTLSCSFTLPSHSADSAKSHVGR